MASGKKRKKPCCRVQGCNNQPHSRGVCSTCYSVLWQKVRSGKTTWEMLEASGVVAPKLPLGRPRAAAVYEAIENCGK